MSKEIEHTEYCIKSHKAYDEEKAEFEAKYPNYCRECSGWGYTEYRYDPSPPGVSLAPGYMIDRDPCEFCEAGDVPVCSLCGKPLDLDSDEWDNYCNDYPNVTKPCGCPTDVGLSPRPECWCGYEAHMKELDRIWEEFLGKSSLRSP